MSSPPIMPVAVGRRPDLSALAFLVAIFFVQMFDRMK
jgi:hypothetical protein